MIQFENVSKTYPNGTHALHNVSLNIKKGEFVFIVGPSGAGKSTFLKLIMHEESPSEGKIVINGTDITRLKRRDVPFLRRHMGIVFQDFRLIDKMTVFENVAFAMRAVGEGTATIKKRVPYVLNLVGLKDKMKDKPSELSGGEQQRVSLARALVNNPEIIVADEPTGNVDPELSHEILELLTEINNMGTTVLVVTHEHELVREFHQRVIAIDSGRIVSDSAEDHVEEAFAELASENNYVPEEELISEPAPDEQAEEEFAALPEEDAVPEGPSGFVEAEAEFSPEPQPLYDDSEEEEYVDVNAFAAEAVLEADEYEIDAYKGAHYAEEEEDDAPQYPDNVFKIPD